MDTELARIEGTDRISGVVLRHGSGREERLACDGVVFSGRFVSESALARMGHLEVDPASGGPVTDQFGRCSDPALFRRGQHGASRRLRGLLLAGRGGDGG